MLIHSPRRPLGSWHWLEVRGDREDGVGGCVGGGVGLKSTAGGGAGVGLKSTAGGGAGVGLKSTGGGGGLVAWVGASVGLVAWVGCG